MVTGSFSVVRTGELDDARDLMQLYDPSYPRTFLLDGRRELQPATIDDLREVLSRKEIKSGPFYVIEDLEGIIRGVCSLKTPSQEAGFSEAMFALIQEADYASSLAAEVMAFLKQTAFLEKRLNKILAQCLENETGLMELLLREGFTHNGTQREAVFTLGRYYNIETFTLFRADYVTGG